MQKVLLKYYLLSLLLLLFSLLGSFPHSLVCWTMLLKVWSLDPQRHHSPSMCEQCRVSGRTQNG